MKQLLAYLFWPNPPAPAYSSPKVMIALIACAVMIVAGFAVSRWHKNVAAGVTRRLSASWSSALYWFGCTGIFMVICRVEGISFLSMRVFWAVWLAVILLYLLLQVKLFRTRHYEVLPRAQADDPRDRYLPGRRKR